MLRPLIKKVEYMQEQMGNISNYMETLKKKYQKEMLGKKEQ